LNVKHNPFLGVLEEISGVMEGKKEGKTSNGGLEGGKRF
jgi:hypothetical protein